MDGRQLRALLRLLDAVREFRKIGPNLPLGYLDAFLTVALRPGLGPTDYARMMGVMQPSASRVLAEIGDRPRERDERMRLVTRVVDPQSRRSIQFFLSPRGRTLAERLGGILEQR